MNTQLDDETLITWATLAIRLQILLEALNLLDVSIEKIKFTAEHFNLS